MENEMHSDRTETLLTFVQHLRKALLQHESEWKKIASRADLGLHTVEGFAKKWAGQSNPTLTTLIRIADAIDEIDTGTEDIDYAL
jgi:hypothetical protein